MNDRERWFGRIVVAAVLMSAAIGWTGCAPSGAIDSQPGTTAAGVSAAPTVALEVVDRAGFDAIVAKQRGKVVLVDMWATWCRPCMDQMSHTVALFDRYHDRGLAVLTLSLNEPDDLESVRQALRAKRAVRMTNMVSKFGISAKSAEAFQIPGGALPHYQLYDRSGQLRQTFATDPAADHPFTEAEIDAAVLALLGE